MPIYSSSLQEVSSSGRLDAEYYSPDHVRVWRTLARSHTIPLPALCTVHDGNHAGVSRHFQGIAEGNIRYLRGQDVGQFFLSDRKPVYVSPAVFCSLNTSEIKPGDVLLTIVGTVGAVSLVPADARRQTASCKIATLRPRDGVIRGEYLAAFLNGRYGQSQIRRLTRGAVQTGLLLADMKNIRVPRLGVTEDRVADSVSAAYGDLQRSEQMLKDSYGLLNERWPMYPWAPGDHIEAFSESLQKISRSRRLDAEYFRPRFSFHAQEILRTAKGEIRGFTAVGSVLAALTNGHTPRHHDLTVGDVRFLTAENVTGFEIDYETKKRITSRHHQTELANTQVRPGDLLFTIKGRVGDAAPVTSSLHDETNINQDVALLRLRGGLHPYFFAGWFNSNFGRTFVEQAVTGAINPFIALGTLRRMPFPNIDSTVQNEIGTELENRVRAALKLKQQANRSLADAVESVCTAIEEQGEPV